jgi:hypothetical protein
VKEESWTSKIFPAGNWLYSQLTASICYHSQKKREDSEGTATDANAREEGPKEEVEAEVKLTSTIIREANKAISLGP